MYAAATPTATWEQPEEEVEEDVGDLHSISHVLTNFYTAPHCYCTGVQLAESQTFTSYII